MKRPPIGTMESTARGMDDGEKAARYLEEELIKLTYGVTSKANAKYIKGEKYR